MLEIKNNKNRLMCEINVIPLVDIILVLLIIFMITTPILVKNTDVNLPKSNIGSSNYKEEKLVVSVTKEGKIFFDNSLIYIEELSKKLINTTNNKSQPKIYLRADKEVSYGKVVMVISEIYNAGFFNLGILTESENFSLSEKNNTGRTSE